MLPAATLPIRTSSSIRIAQPSGADGWAQFRHPPYPKGRSKHAAEQPAETDGCQPQTGLGDIVAEQHRHGKEASERQHVQMLDSPRATPVEQPENKADRRRYGDEQRMQRERAVGDRRGEPATALRYEPMTNWHERGQHPQPTNEHEHEQTNDRQFVSARCSWPHLSRPQRPHVANSNFFRPHPAGVRTSCNLPGRVPFLAAND